MAAARTSQGQLDARPRARADRTERRVGHPSRGGKIIFASAAPAMTLQPGFRPNFRRAPGRLAARDQLSSGARPRRQGRSPRRRRRCCHAKRPATQLAITLPVEVSAEAKGRQSRRSTGMTPQDTKASRVKSQSQSLSAQRITASAAKPSAARFRLLQADVGRRPSGPLPRYRRAVASRRVPIMRVEEDRFPERPIRKPVIYKGFEAND